MGHVGFFDLRAIRGSCKIFVETGAGEGYSTKQLASIFDVGICVEINPVVADALRAKHLTGVAVIQGDSRVMLPLLVPVIKEPCLFWLNAHYPEKGQVVNYAQVPGVPGTTHPLVAELKAILTRDYDDVILIDDVHIYGDRGFASGGLPAEYAPATGLWELLDSCDRNVELFHEDGGYLKITR